MHHKIVEMNQTLAKLETLWADEDGQIALAISKRNQTEEGSGLSWEDSREHAEEYISTKKDLVVTWEEEWKTETRRLASLLQSSLDSVNSQEEEIAETLLQASSREEVKALFTSIAKLQAHKESLQSLINGVAEGDSPFDSLPEENDFSGDKEYEINTLIEELNEGSERIHSVAGEMQEMLQSYTEMVLASLSEV